MAWERPATQAQELARHPGATSEHGQMLADVSNAIVRIHKQFYGKGPVKARAHLSQEVLTVILEGGFTRGEQTLHDRGHAQEVVRSRLAMQASVEDEFRTAIETIMYRSVRSFMSANDPSNDLQAEIFVLYPRGAEILDETEDGLGHRAGRARERNHEVLEEHRALRSEQTQSRLALRHERNQQD